MNIFGSLIILGYLVFCFDLCKPKIASQSLVLKILKSHFLKCATMKNLVDKNLNYQNILYANLIYLKAYIYSSYFQ